mgnify:CR=1 FL=1
MPNTVSSGSGGATSTVSTPEIGQAMLKGGILPLPVGGAQQGVLAAVANIFTQHGVSIETVEQAVARTQDGSRVATATLEVGTHLATEAALTAVVNSLATSPVVEKITSVIRVEGI